MSVPQTSKQKRLLTIIHVVNHLFMLKEIESPDQMFRLIKRITPVIVILYVLFCCLIIRKSHQDPLLNKSNLSIVVDRSLALQEAGNAP